MGRNLVKGQTIELKKFSGEALNKIIIGLNWKNITDKKKKKNAFSGENIDCDAVAVLCNKEGRAAREDIVCFINLKHKSGSVILGGDNLTGSFTEDDVDDEQICVMLDKVPVEYDSIFLAVNINQARIRRQHFGVLPRGFVRIEDGDTEHELYRFNLVSDEYDGMTSMIVGKIFATEDGWKFHVMGEGTTDASVTELYKNHFA